MCYWWPYSFFYVNFSWVVFFYRFQFICCFVENTTESVILSIFVSWGFAFLSSLAFLSFQCQRIHELCLSKQCILHPHDWPRRMIVDWLTILWVRYSIYNQNLEWCHIHMCKYMSLGTHCSLLWLQNSNCNHHNNPMLFVDRYILYIILFVNEIVENNNMMEIDSIAISSLSIRREFMTTKQGRI